MFGKRLKELRVSKNMSQEEPGKRMGVTKQTISNWENEKITPALDMFEKLVKFFHTTPNRMLGYEKHVMMDVDGLTENQIAHIQMLVNDFKACNEGE